MTPSNSQTTGQTLLPPGESPQRDAICDALTKALRYCGDLAYHAGERTTIDLRDEGHVRALARLLTTNDRDDGWIGKETKDLWERIAAALSAPVREAEPREIRLAALLASSDDHGWSTDGTFNATFSATLSPSGAREVADIVSDLIDNPAAARSPLSETPQQMADSRSRAASGEVPRCRQPDCDPDECARGCWMSISTVEASDVEPRPGGNGGERE